jgi:hypothetical protein
MTGAEQVHPGIAYRSRPPVLRAQETPLLWFGRARVAALLLFTAAVTPWSMLFVSASRVILALVFASVLLSCAGTWLLTADADEFPFDDRSASRLRLFTRAAATAELLLWACLAADLLRPIPDALWAVVIGIHISAMSTRLLTLRWVRARIRATESARNMGVLLKAYLISKAFLVAAFLPVLFGDLHVRLAAPAIVFALVGTLGLLLVYGFGCAALLVGAADQRIVLEEHWVRDDSAEGRHWATMALLRGGQVLVLLPRQRPRAFCTAAEAWGWLSRQLYALPAELSDRAREAR